VDFLKGHNKSISHNHLNGLKKARVSVFAGFFFALAKFWDALSTRRFNALYWRARRIYSALPIFKTRRAARANAEHIPNLKARFP
jgi:hypothetical protein